MNNRYWLLWGLLTLTIAGYFLYVMLLSEDKSELLIGEASHGHYQIEMACSACHTDPFGGPDMLQNACENCHGEELKIARDSHPKKKFTDPRNANLVEILDARYCVSCHTEHQQEQTHPMGLTLPGDYCFHCHEDVGDERESHKELAFDSCASSGCHNFHDNRALFEDFLLTHADGSWVAAVADLAKPNSAEKKAKTEIKAQQDFEQQRSQHPDIESQLLASAHGKAGVECGGCHTGESGGWLEKPQLQQCQSCHQQEAKGFLAGKHGMRLALELTPLTPAMSALDFKQDSLNIEHGCTSCHSAHDFDTRVAAVQACVGCHDDEHSRAFNDSPHGQLAQQALQNQIPWGQAVTCATCHMPRLIHGKENSPLDLATTAEMGNKIEVMVQHNQNDMLRPNEKMIRPICMSCHSLEFSIDALADKELINNNFKGKPQNHVPSIDWAIKRVQ